jgi:hypothetical protein
MEEFLMSRNLKIKQVIIILLCSGLAFNGCSVIGTVIGIANDRSQPSMVPVEAWDVDGLAPGRKIRVITKVGSVITGRYKGIEQLDDSIYSAQYDGCRGKLKNRIWLPDLGEELQFKLVGIDELFGLHFMGFEPQGVMVQKIDTGKKGMAPVDKIEQIKDDDGNVLTGGTLKELMIEGAISYFSQILLQKDITVAKIPLDEVDHIEAKNKKYGIFIALLGFAVDILLVEYLIKNPLYWGLW